MAAPVRRDRVRSVVFAAGEGRRLRPLTEHVPKPALPVLDIPLAAFAIGSLSPLGRVVVNVGANAPTLETRLLGVFADLPELLREGDRPWGTAATLRALVPRVADDVIVWNADALVDIDPRDLVETHRRGKAGLTLAVRPVDEEADLLAKRKAVEFVDRRRQQDLGGFQYVGVAVIAERSVRELGHAGPAGLAEALFRPLAERGDIGLHVHEGYALDVGTPARYLQANLDALYRHGPAPPIRFPGVVTGPPEARRYIGERAAAGGRGVGRGAVVMRGARVSPGARVQEAVVWPGEKVPSSANVTRSIWALGEAHPAS